MSNRVVCWFSAGAASLFATYLTLKKHPDAVVAYCDTGGEHSSNKTFIEAAAEWMGVEVTVLRSDKYIDHFDVFERRRFIVGRRGIPCTVELKKKPREAFQQPDDIHVFGFTVDERKRADRLKANMPELNMMFPLIDQQIDKRDCLAFLTRVGLPMPEMYRLGYPHNNCIGCPKGGRGYWNKIRVDFPDAFERMAKLERELKVSIFRDGDRRVFLDELSPDAGRIETNPMTGCSLFCDSAIAEVGDD